MALNATEDYRTQSKLMFTQTGYRWLGTTRINCATNMTINAAIIAGAGTNAVNTQVRAMSIKPDSGVTINVRKEGGVCNTTFGQIASGGETRPMTSADAATASIFGGSATIEQWG